MTPFIETRRTRYIIPFRINSEKHKLSDMIESIAGYKDIYGGRFIQNSTKISAEQDIYSYVLDMFAEVDCVKSNNVGASFLYQKSEKNINKGIIDLMYSRKNDNDIVFSITQMGLYVFDLGVCFLWYEIGDDELTVGEGQMKLSFTDREFAIEFNNRFKEMNYSVYQRKIKMLNSDEEFTMGNYIAEILKDLGDVRYFGFRRNTVKRDAAPEFVPDKALIFNYLHFYKDFYSDIEKEKSVPKKYKKYYNFCYAKKEDGTSKRSLSEDREGVDNYDWNRCLEETAYYLTKGYKRSYEIPDSISDDLFKPFGNAYWFVAKEGAGYYVVSDKAANNNEFFSGQMSGKVMNDYFLIYILALYQSYTVLSFAEDISNKLPASADSYISELSLKDGVDEADNRLEECINYMRTSLNVFLTKSVKASISYVGQQNDFFTYAKEKLSISKDVENVLAGLESLQNLLSDSRQHKEEEKEKTKEKQIAVFVGILSFVGFVSVIEDGLSLYKDFFLNEETKKYAGSLFNSLWTVKLLFWLFVFVFIFIIYKIVKVQYPNIDFFIKSVKRKLKVLFSNKRTKGNEEYNKAKYALNVDVNRVFERNTLDYYAQVMLAQAKKKRQDIYVAKVCIDKYEEHIFVYGTEEGEKVNETFAKLVSDAVGSHGRVIRTGGYELTIIAIGNPGENVGEAIEAEMARAVNLYNMNHEERKFDLSILVGSDYRHKTMRLNDLKEAFETADKHLKNAGEQE